MTDKTKRLIGICFFSSVVSFLFWYVNYDYPRIVGFGTNPYGYGSFAYQVIHGILGRNYYYDHSQENFFWSVTQVAPLLLAWKIRTHLGIVVNYATILIKKTYGAI